MKFSLALFLAVFAHAVAAIAEPLSFSDVEGGKHTLLTEDKKALR